MKYYRGMKKRNLFPLSEMDLKFSKIIIFSDQCEILEFQKYYLMGFMFTFDLP